MPHLEIHDLTVSYEKNKPTLEQFSLDVEQGELLSLLGPSGCGKTTTLRSVAALFNRIPVRLSSMTGIIRTCPPISAILVWFSRAMLCFPHLTVSTMSPLACGCGVFRRKSLYTRRQCPENGGIGSLCRPPSGTAFGRPTTARRLSPAPPLLNRKFFCWTNH